MSEQTPIVAATSEQTPSIEPESSDNIVDIAGSIMPGIRSLSEETDAKQPADEVSQKLVKESTSSEEAETETDQEKELSEKEARSEWHRRLAKFESREKKFNVKLAKLKDQMALVQAAERALSADLTMLTKGEGAQVLEALARITKRDPAMLYEQISLAVLGKKPEDAKAARELEEMRERLDAAEREISQGKNNSQRNAVAAQKRDELHTLIQDTAQWPLLASYTEKDPEGTAAYVRELYTEECAKADAWLDTDVVLDRIERQLRINGLAGADKPAAGSGPGRVQGSRDVSQNPAVAQRSPSSLPTSTASAGSMRELRDEERLNPDLYGDVLNQLGL